VWPRSCAGTRANHHHHHDCLRIVRKSGPHSTAPAFSPSASTFNAGASAFGSALSHTAGGSAPSPPMQATWRRCVRALRGHLKGIDTSFVREGDRV
jgi:hypothetical protein